MPLSSLFMNSHNNTLEQEEVEAIETIQQQSENDDDFWNTLGLPRNFVKAVQLMERDITETFMHAYHAALQFKRFCQVILTFSMLSPSPPTLSYPSSQ